MNRREELAKRRCELIIRRAYLHEQKAEILRRRKLREYNIDKEEDNIQEIKLAEIMRRHNLPAY